MFDYKKFSANDFAMDAFFREWVLKPTPDASAFWKNWLWQNPEKSEVIEKARKIVITLKNAQEEIRYTYFQINLNEHDQIYHESKLITEKKLESLIFKFLDLNKNNSRFKIEATGKTKYDFCAENSRLQKQGKCHCAYPFDLG